MKKLIMGILAGLGIAWTAEYLRRHHKKNPVVSVKGIVTEIGEKSFQIEAFSEGGKVMIFHVSPLTKFIWLASADGGSNAGHFSDLALNTKVTVIYVKKEEKTENKAERVIIEAVK